MFYIITASYITDLTYLQAGILQVLHKYRKIHYRAYIFIARTVQVLNNYSQIHHRSYIITVRYSTGLA